MLQKPCIASGNDIITGYVWVWKLCWKLDVVVKTKGDQESFLQCMKTTHRSSATGLSLLLPLVAPVMVSLLASRQPAMLQRLPCIAPSLGTVITLEIWVKCLENLNCSVLTLRIRFRTLNWRRQWWGRPSDHDQYVQPMCLPLLPQFISPKHGLIQIAFGIKHGIVIAQTLKDALSDHCLYNLSFRHWGVQGASSMVHLCLLYHQAKTSHSTRTQRALTKAKTPTHCRFHCCKDTWYLNRYN